MSPEETRLRAWIDWAFDAMTSDVVVERSDLDALLSEVERLRGEADQHRARAERLAATLRFYASKNAWRSVTVYMCGHSAPSQAVLDGGRRALRALAQEGEG